MAPKRVIIEMKEKSVKRAKKVMSLEKKIEVLDRLAHNESASSVVCGVRKSHSSLGLLRKKTLQETKRKVIQKQRRRQAVLHHPRRTESQREVTLEETELSCGDVVLIRRKAQYLAQDSCEGPSSLITEEEYSHITSESERSNRALSCSDNFSEECEATTTSSWKCSRDIGCGEGPLILISKNQSQSEINQAVVTCEQLNSIDKQDIPNSHSYLKRGPSLNATNISKQVDTSFKGEKYIHAAQTLPPSSVSNLHHQHSTNMKVSRGHWDKSSQVREEYYGDQNGLRGPASGDMPDVASFSKSYEKNIYQPHPQSGKEESLNTSYQDESQYSPMDSKVCPASNGNFTRREVATADRRMASSRPFPFQPTPSGNLKIVPNQVIYETKKVSVLVANPKKTKINVTKESDWHSPPNLEMKKLIKCCQRKEMANEMFPGMQNLIQDFSLPPADLEPHIAPSQGELCETREGPAGEGLKREESESLTKASDDESEAGLKRFFPPADNEIEWTKCDLPAKTHMLKLLNERIINYVNPDIIVCVGNDQFYCHHLVLQCYSSFFDKECEKMMELPLNKVSSQAFSLIYDWMIFSGQDSYILLRRDNILEIFMAAQFLGIKELEEQCWAFIDSPMLFSEATAFMLYLDARKKNNKEVAQLMVPRVTMFFLPLVASRDFLQLSVEDVCTFLSSNYIQINCEMQVFMSAVRWLMNDWSARACHLVEVMHCVRFGWIVPWQLVDIRRNPANPEFIQVTSHPDIMQMVDDGIAFAIVHYWYGKAKEDECYEWVKALDLKVPQQRNWDSRKQEYGTYQEFLDELDSICKSMEKRRRQIKRMRRMNTNRHTSGQTIDPSSNQLAGTSGAIVGKPKNLRNGGTQRTLVRDGGLPRGVEQSVSVCANMCEKNTEFGKLMPAHNKVNNGKDDEYPCYPLANNQGFSGSPPNIAPPSEWLNNSEERRESGGAYI